MTAQEKILIVGPSWVGDMVMAQSLFMALKEAYPNCLIDVLAPDWSLPLIEKMPEISNAIALPVKHGQFNLMARLRLGKQLRSKYYNQAIVLPNSWKSALIPFFAKIPKRTGFLGEFRWGLLNDVKFLDKSKLTMTVQRFVALSKPDLRPKVQSYPLPAIPLNVVLQEQIVKKFKLDLSKKVLALCPGAEFGPSKRWPAEYFAMVAEEKLRQGWQVWLLGTEKDRPSANIINEITAGNCLDFVGQTALTEVVELLSFAHTVVTNDSGLMHIAAALDKKLIALYGSTPPELSPPLSPSADICFLNLPCSPCRKRVCSLYPVGHLEHGKCLTGIKPETILELIAE